MNTLENRIAILEKQIEPHADLELILTNLLVYSKKHKGWVITKESIENFDVNNFTKCYTVWVGYEDITNLDDFPHLANYLSIKDLEIMLRADAFDYFADWLCDTEVININIQDYKKSKHKFRGVVLEKDIVQPQYYLNIEKSQNKITKLIFK